MIGVVSKEESERLAEMRAGEREVIKHTPTEDPKMNRASLLNMLGAGLAVGASMKVNVDGKTFTLHKLTPKELETKMKKRAKRKAQTKARKRNR